MLLCFILTYLLFRSLCDSFEPNALTACAYWGIFALATAAICVRQRCFPKQAIPAGLLSLTLSMSFLLHNDPDLHVAIFLLLIPLSGFYCIALTGANRQPFGSFYVLLDLLHCELFTPLKHLPAPFTDTLGCLQRRRSDRQTKTHVRWLPVVIGLLAAMPILLIVVPLLIDADAAFETVMGGLYRHIGDALSAFGDWVARTLPFNGFALVFALLFTPYILSVIHAFASGTAKRENRDTAARCSSLQRLPVAFVATVLGAVSAVYLIYLLTQTGYFFAAFAGRLPFGVSITVTEYARRGFFELCKLAGVNFVLLALSVGLTGRKNGRIASLVKGFDIFLCLFTMLLCVISSAKIMLYIRTFGLTEKRLYVFAADIVLFVVFLAILLRLRFERFPYMKVMLCALFTVTAALGLCGVGNTIAWYNTNGLLSGRLQEMTVNDIYNESGYAALPYLQKLAEGETTHAKHAQQELHALAFYGDPWSEIPEGEEQFRNLEYEKYLRFVRAQMAQASSFQILIDFYNLPPVYTLGYVCQLNGKNVSSGGAQNADNTPLGKNTTITIDREMLPENADLSALEIRFSLYLEPGDQPEKEYYVHNHDDTRLYPFAFGRVYAVEISQNTAGDFEAVW